MIGELGGSLSVVRSNLRRIPRKWHSAAGVCAAIALLPLIAGCTTATLGPERPISIEEDVNNIRPVAEPPLENFYQLSLTRQASARNQIITARMYIADLEYHKYEAKLTRDLQEEGLAATLTTLGLTSAASLITVASTSRILSGAATVVTGADKAFDDKVLLSNTIQALQAQMRTDRQTQAAAIFAKMTTPIDQYTLPMALSDVDHYYQAGTLASALIGLNKTVATAEQNATTAHDLAGPNGEVVTNLKAVANPSPLSSASVVIRDVRQQLSPGGPQLPPNVNPVDEFNKRLDASLCVSAQQPRQVAIRDYLMGTNQQVDPNATSVTITPAFQRLLERAVAAVPSCKTSPFMNAFEVGRFGLDRAKGSALIKLVQGVLRTSLNLSATALPDSGKFDKATRDAIMQYRKKNNIAPDLGTQMDAGLLAQMF